MCHTVCYSSILLPLSRIGISKCGTPGTDFGRGAIGGCEGGRGEGRGVVKRLYRDWVV